MTKEEKQKGKINEKCDCCARDVDREVLNLKSDIKKFSYLGSGFPMFFSFLKLCVFLLVIVFCIAGIFNMVSNKYGGDNCLKKESECKSSWLTEYSIGNKTDSFYYVYV